MPLLFSNKIDIYFYIINNISMKRSYEDNILALQMQLEDALQMLRLVSKNKRTCLEVEEWLSINFPDFIDDDDQSTMYDLLKHSKKQK